MTMGNKLKTDTESGIVQHILISFGVVLRTKKNAVSVTHFIPIFLPGASRLMFFFFFGRKECQNLPVVAEKKRIREKLDRKVFLCFFLISHYVVQQTIAEVFL